MVGSYSAVIPKNGGTGRRTPHMFGAGLVEMIGIQLRQQALGIADTNRDGWISLKEAKGKRCVIRRAVSRASTTRWTTAASRTAATAGPAKDGKRIPSANSLKNPGVAGYTFEVQCFGFGHLYVPFRPPVSTTIRSFIATPLDIHMGLQAFDPTTLNEDPDGHGFSGWSNAGVQQCITAAGRDRVPSAGRPASASMTRTGTGIAKRSARATWTWPSGTC